jgi:hypothetical protein
MEISIFPRALARLRLRLRRQPVPVPSGEALPLHMYLKILVDSFADAVLDDVVGYLSDVCCGGAGALPQHAALWYPVLQAHWYS